MSEKRKRKRSGYEHYEQRTDEKKRLDNLDSKQFEFVHMDERIHDKKFETKPVGYFRDAMTRFAKNKTNVTATIILFTLIFLSIIVPAVTTKNIDTQEHEISFLPPRIPFLENFGIFDGTRRVEDATVDRDTIDPETGLGLPDTALYNPEFILMDTLENYSVSCAERTPDCYGGRNILQIVRGTDNAVITSHQPFEFDRAKNSIIQIEIDDITEGANTEFKILVDPLGVNDYEVVGTITEPGVHEIDPLEELPELFYSNRPLRLELVSDDDQALVSIKSIKLFDDTQEEPVTKHYGFDLSLYLANPGQNRLRFTEEQDAVMLRSHESFEMNFTFDDAYEFVIDVDEMTETEETELHAYVDLEGIGELVLIGTITEEGTHELLLPADMQDMLVSSRLYLELVSDEPDAFVSLSSIELYKVPEEAGRESLVRHEGSSLANYRIEFGEAEYQRINTGGDYYRRDGEYLFASFNYDRYADAFGDRREIYSSRGYYRILEENPEICEPREDPDNPDGFLFDEECPFVRVIRQTELTEHRRRQQIQIASGHESYAVRSRVPYEFNMAQYPTLHFIVVDIYEDAPTQLNIYLDHTQDGNYELFATMDSVDRYTFDLQEILGDIPTFSTQIVLEVESESDEGFVTLRRITHNDESQADPIWEHDGEDFISGRYVDHSGEGSVFRPIFYSYELILNYQRYGGYDEIPYFFFGTTASGRDLFAMTMLGLRTSLFIGVAVSIVNIAIGIFYGAIEGYYGGKVDLLMERFAEVVGRIPWLVTLSIVVALLGPGVWTLFVLLVFSGWVGISGITRTQFYRFKNREYVLASRSMGAKDSRLIFRHILPNAIGTIITMSILAIPLVIFTESTISYLGFGIGHGTDFHILGVRFSGVSIGVLLADGRAHMYAQPYLTVAPAIIISILMITFNMFGNALRDAFNPSLRGVE